MHDRQDGTPSGDDRNLDPRNTPKSTEEVRRELYDAVVAVHFQPSPEEVQQAKEDPENHWVRDYTPEQAGLTVVKAFGRWIAIWRSLEQKDGPEALQWTVLRIVPAPAGSPMPAEFLEV